MVRASASTKKKKPSTDDDGPIQDGDALTRKRLKKLAISNGILSETPARTGSTLTPSKTVVKHHGKDILRKSQRKNRFLFSFPGLIGPVGGGRIGELKDLGTKNPILYLDFPQGQMKLFGTIVYPKNRYLTLQFSRGGKNVMCEDYFDNMIVFSDAWWIGRKEENPEEKRLDLPKELTEGQNVECDFKGGVGGESVSKQVTQKSGTNYSKESPKTDVEDDDDDEADLKELKEQTPTRHSHRTAGKTFKFTEVSSGDDSINSDANISNEEKEEEDDWDEDKEKLRTKISSEVILDLDNKGTAEVYHSSERIQVSATSEAKSKQLSEFAVCGTTTKEDAHIGHGSLVQSTLSTLFKKVQEKKKEKENNAPKSSRKSLSSKDLGKKLQQTNLKRKIDEAERPKKSAKLPDAKKSGVRTAAKAKKKVYEVEEDDIEEFSSSSHDIDGSDKDWEA